MQFGLCNASSTFQHTLENFFTDLKWSACPVYVDGVIVSSDTFEDHLEHVGRVLTIARYTGLALNIAKCHFFKTFVDYLGLIFVTGRLKVALKNTSSIS